jgi:CelD/BcsL family acetyltransferase involved in cellulose biosynthesis
MPEPWRTLQRAVPNFSSASGSLEIITSLPSLLELRPEWTSLVHNLDYTTPFHLPEWLLTWWKHFGSGQLHVFAFRCDGALVGLIPCFLHQWQGLRQLTLVGTGISDYLDPPLADNSQTLNLLKNHLESNPHWDICSWQDLSANSRLVQAFPAHVTEDMPCSAIPLEGSFDEYWRNRPHGLRRNLRRYGEKASRIDTPQFRVVCNADPALTEALIRLHTDRWKDQGEEGMIVANRSAGFLREVVRELERENRVRFFSLSFQREIVAIILGFLYRGIFFSYLSGFDPAYEAYGFGRQLLYESIQYAFEQHWTAWNFLRGDEPYKFSWGAKPIQKSRLIIRR